MLELWDGLYANVPHHAAEILQQRMPGAVQQREAVLHGHAGQRMPGIRDADPAERRSRALASMRKRGSLCSHEEKYSSAGTSAGQRDVSASLLAQIMHSKYVLALPRYRQEQELRRLGLPVSRQTMSNWVLTAGERWLLPVYHVLHKELLANEILHADETTLMVLREPERQALADELGEDGIQELAQRYAEAYEGCYDGAELDAYIEEICADAYAGMDRLPEAKTQIIQKAAQRAQAEKAAEENGGTRAPPEKYSMVGYGSNGLKTYKSDFSSDMTATEKQEYFIA